MNLNIENRNYESKGDARFANGIKGIEGEFSQKILESFIGFLLGIHRIELFSLNEYNSSPQKDASPTMLPMIDQKLLLRFHLSEN